MWYLKIKRHGYGSVLGTYDAKHLAEAERDKLNERYQTDEYYVEAFKAGW